MNDEGNDLGLMPFFKQFFMRFCLQKKIYEEKIFCFLTFDNIDGSATISENGNFGKFFFDFFYIIDGADRYTVKIYNLIMEFEKNVKTQSVFLRTDVSLEGN